LVCGQVAVDAAESSLHFHGGYGFMLEYEVQRYVRRAKAARIGARRSPARAANHRGVPLGGDRTGLDRKLDVSAEAFRTEVRTFLADNLTDEMIEEAHRPARCTTRTAPRHRVPWLPRRGWPVEVGAADAARSRQRC